jgi:uncharacterized protein with HEPN domain
MAFISDSDFRLFMQNIVGSIGRIERYTSNLDIDSFRNNEMATDAVVRNFEIIGNASAHIPEYIRVKYPSIPWDTMKAMKNVVAHEYPGIDYKTLWETIKTSLQTLKQEVARVIEMENGKLR